MTNRDHKRSKPDEGHQDHVVDEAPQEVEKAKNRTLQQDHAVLQEKFRKVMDGEDVNVMFPVSHNEKFFSLKMKNKIRRIGSWSLNIWRESLLV